MSKAFYSVLQGALALLAGIANFPMVREFLMSIGFPMDWLSQGNAMVEGAQAAVARKGVLLETRKGLRGVIKQMLGNLRKEVTALRFVAARAFVPRPDLLDAYSLKRKRKAKNEEPSQPTATTPAGKDGKSSQPDETPRRPAGTPVGRFVEKARALVEGILADPGALSLVSPYGYGEQQLRTLLSRIVALVEKDLEWQTAKANYTSAVAEVRERAKEFRRWFTPWRKLLAKALEPRPDLLAKLGLPVPKPRVSHRKKEGDEAKQETTGAAEKVVTPEHTASPTPPKA